MIPFNKPYFTGKEISYIQESFSNRKVSGNGPFTQKCQDFFQGKLACPKCLLTTSCTDALEMCAILADIQPGEEVIVPSYTFVSSALAFVRQGAHIVFADCLESHPCLDPDKLEQLITPQTRAIVAVHYAGVACDMDPIMQLAQKYNLLVIEDAAQGIDSFYKGRPLGSIGHLAAFSFHETKNIQCGEGGLLVINDQRFVKRAEIIWEKGTNRAEFFRGEINKYGWVDTGSSFLASDYTAAFLYAQLEAWEDIQSKRKNIWDIYTRELKGISGAVLPYIPGYATNNAHLFYMMCGSLEERTNLIAFLKENGIQAVFHYLSLHESNYIKNQDKELLELPQTEKYADCLLRLPLFYELEESDIKYIVTKVVEFYKKNK